MAYGKAVQALNSARVTVYPFQVLGEMYPPDPATRSYSRTDYGLKQFATQTGGHKFDLGTDVETAVSEVRRYFGPYYVLSLAVVPPKEHANWVAIKIKANRQDLRVYSPTGFLAVP